MAAVTMSGYSVIGSYGDAALVSNPFIPGTERTVQALGGLRRGAVATCLLYVACRWHREVEPLRQALGCWGYELRTIRQGAAMSNHAAGAAIDLNASVHGQGAHGTLNREQLGRVAQIEASTAGALNWGGRFTGGSTDEMHWQVRDGHAGDPVEALALSIRRGEVINVPAELRAGQGPAQPAPGPPPRPALSRPAYPFVHGDGRYFGPLSGPANSISGQGPNDAKYRSALLSWQLQVKRRGFDTGTPDGLYGPRTAAAARAVQSAAHLTVDSLIGWDTWAAAWRTA